MQIPYENKAAALLVEQVLEKELSTFQKEVEECRKELGKRLQVHILEVVGVWMRACEMRVFAFCVYIVPGLVSFQS